MSTRVDYGYAVDNDMRDATRIAARLLEGGDVGDRARIEDRDVGLGALAQHAAVGEASAAAVAPVILCTASGSVSRPRSRA